MVYRASGVQRKDAGSASLCRCEATKKGQSYVTVIGSPEERRMTSWMMHSRLEAMKRLAKSLREKKAEIFAYFKDRLMTVKSQ